jgi:Tfp pilus assembly protein PilF
MFELTAPTDPRGPQSLAGMAELYRRHHHHHHSRRYYRANTCLVTLNGSLNGLCILNILNGFGGF